MPRCGQGRRHRPPTPAKAEMLAEELAAYDSRLASVDHRLTMLTWQVGGLAVVMTIVGFRRSGC